MSEPIKLYIKETVVSGAENEFKLDLIEHDNNTLYDASSGPTVELGEGSYDFEIEVYLEEPGESPVLVHSFSVTPSQEDPDDTGKPIDFSNRLKFGQGSNKVADVADPSQEDPDETAKPGNLPGSKKLF